MSFGYVSTRYLQDDDTGLTLSYADTAECCAAKYTLVNIAVNSSLDILDANGTRSLRYGM